MKKIILAVDGMTCSACSNGLEKYLNKQNGVINASVNLVMANVIVEYDEKVLNQDKIEKFIDEAGFKSLGEFKEIKIENKSKKEKIKFIIFTFLAILLMYISMGHMINLPTPPYLNPKTNIENYVISLFILTICFIIYGFDILKNGYKNLIHKTPNMDTLVSIGVLTSFLYSLYNMILILSHNSNDVMNLYFESSAIIIYFIKLGRYIDGLSKDKTKDAIKKLVKITPNNAVIKINGKLKEATIDEIKKGDIVVSKSGEKIAVDGKIVFGETHLDESFITGESKPVSKKIGDDVIAGSLNYDGYIEYEAVKIGKESTISEIVRLVLEATNSKPKISLIADKVASYFVPSVILISIITFIVYLILGFSFKESIITFVTILVVACPCSLGLATPLAIVVSEGLCATNGILVKKSEVLEVASKINTVVFDKTGTLTYGKLKVENIINYSSISNDDLMQIVGSMEVKSTHPISRAFTTYMEDKNISYLDVDNFKNISGYGISGMINNEEIILGNSKILKKYNIKNKYISDEEKLVNLGNSIIYVVKNKNIIGLIGVNDIIRNESKEVIKALKNMNVDVVMLTGDNSKTAQIISNSIGINDVVSDVLPKEKNEIIKRLKKDNKIVMMCGDGINDSPALASSDIGVSINSGTDIAMNSADVILINNDLRSIIKLLNISKKTIKNIKQNLFWAFLYNILMIPIAIGLFKNFGISINPMLASLAMVLSSITVVLNTLRIKHIKER